MHTTKIKGSPEQVTLLHNGDFSGPVRITWRAGGRLVGCWVEGDNFLPAGHFKLAPNDHSREDGHWPEKPDLSVWGQAVSFAQEMVIGNALNNLVERGFKDH